MNASGLTILIPRELQALSLWPSMWPTPGLLRSLKGMHQKLCHQIFGTFGMYFSTSSTCQVYLFWCADLLCLGNTWPPPTPTKFEVIQASHRFTILVNENLVSDTSLHSIPEHFEVFLSDSDFLKAWKMLFKGEKARGKESSSLVCCKLQGSYKPAAKAASLNVVA